MEVKKMFGWLKVVIIGVKKLTVVMFEIYF